LGEISVNVFFESIIKRLKHVFDLEVIGTRLAGLLENLLVAFFIMAAFYLLWRVVQLVMRFTLRGRKFDATTVIFIETIIKYGLFVLALVQALDSAGIKTSAVIASLGIAGLTIGFAAKDALSNIISGILIFLDRPFVIGDLVEIEGGYGRVDRITLRSTRIITADGKMLAVPNTEVINKTVASYTNFPNLRIDIDVTVGVNEDIGRVRQILLAIIKADKEYMDDPSPKVVVTALNDYNVALSLQAWLKDETRHIFKRHELREKVFNALTSEGVDMPFETIRLMPVEVVLPGKA
jgi:small conductance mechanosensitive channel